MSNDLLKTRLKRLKMTITDLGRVLGLGEGTVYNWEDPPRYATAYVDLLETNEMLKKEMQRVLNEHI